MILKLKEKTKKKEVSFQTEEQKEKKSKKKIKIPKTAQDTLPFEEIYDNGLVKVTNSLYCIICSFTNINYMLEREENQVRLFKLYKDVLNSLDPLIHFQLYLNNKAVDANIFIDALIPNKKINDGLDEIHDAYAKNQEHFIDESIQDTADKESYFVLSYTVNKDENHVYEILKKGFRETATQFKRLNSDTKILDVEETLTLLWSFFNPERAEEEKFLLPRDIYKRGVKIKDYIAPSSFRFKTSYIEMGTSFSRTLYIRDFPQSIKDTFISDLMDNSFNLRTSIHIEPRDPGEATNFIQKRITTLETQAQDRKRKNKQSGMDYIPYDLKNSINESTELLESITKRNQKIFLVGIYINVTAKTLEELEDETKTINRICRKHLIICDVLTHQQEAGLATVLPFGYNKVGIKRILDTDSTAIFVPFTAQNIFHKNGFYYGRNQATNSMVIFNRKNLKNANGFILGKPGSGKSLKEKREILDVLERTDDDVIIIDPEREFAAICEEYKGERIVISASADTHLNPLEVSQDYADDDDPIQLKSDFIMSICQTIKGNLTPTEKTIVDRCVRLSYKELLAHNWDEKYMPDFNTFYEFVKKQPEVQEAKDLALAIELYTTGSLNTFSKQSNVKLNNRLTVFDTKDLGKQLKKLGVLITLDAVWNRVCHNRGLGKYTWIITDEFYILFDDGDGEDSYSANYYYELYKRARKWGGVPTGITQNVEDLLRSRKARTMLANSEFLILLDQAPTDRVEIQKLFNLSETQLDYITNAEQGCGLLISGKNIIPIGDVYPKNNKIYDIITTKIGETRETKGNK